MSDATVAAVAKSVVVTREIGQVAEMAVTAMPIYKIRAGKAETFKNLTLAADEKMSWKKGLVYLIARYSKGVNFEMWMYCSKKSAALAQFNDLVRPLAIGEVKCEACGDALKLRLQLADTLTDEEVVAKITEFMTRIEPTLAAIREKITVVVSTKETLAAAPAAEAPAAEVTDTTVPAAPVTDEPKSKRQMKKEAKRAAKAA